MTDTTKYSILTGVSAGLLFLSFIIFNRVDNMRMEAIKAETERLEEFKTWASEICGSGYYSTAEFLSTGEYRTTCGKDR